MRGLAQGQYLDAFLSAGIYAPICLKKAVDALGGVVNQAAVHCTVQALLLSGLCRVANTLAKEAQGPIFTPIAQVLPSPSCILLQAVRFLNAAMLMAQ